MNAATHTIISRKVVPSTRHFAANMRGLHGVLVRSADGFTAWGFGTDDASAEASAVAAANKIPRS